MKNGHDRPDLETQLFIQNNIITEVEKPLVNILCASKRRYNLKPRASILKNI